MMELERYLRNLFEKYEELKQEMIEQEQEQIERMISWS